MDIVATDPVALVTVAVELKVPVVFDEFEIAPPLKLKVPEVGQLAHAAPGSSSDETMATTKKLKFRRAERAFSREQAGDDMVRSSQFGANHEFQGYRGGRG
jgi:hypothetical protein